MPKQSNYNLCIDELRFINIATFKKANQLNPNTTTQGSYRWLTNDNITNTIAFKLELFENEGILHLNYVCNSKIDIKYSIPIITKDSNLGKGKLYYFICPKTKVLCRKLHFYQGYFYHRSFFYDLIYTKQKQSKKQREIEKYFDDYFDEVLYTEINKKYFKKHYKGKFTKKYKKLLDKIKFKNENKDLLDNKFNLLVLK